MADGEPPARRRHARLRSMVSLDPAMGKSGYPLLLQTGESADGETPLVDRQHPHDAFMELVGELQRAARDGRVGVRLRRPARRARARAADLHAPLFGHAQPGGADHPPLVRLDPHHLRRRHRSASTAGPWKLEGSWFNGREPDEQRWNIETRRLRLVVDAARLESVARVVAAGELRRPEEPGGARARDARAPLTASAMHQGRIAGRDWATTLAWSRNDKRAPGGAALLPALLLESSLARASATPSSAATSRPTRTSCSATAIRATASPGASPSSRSATSATSSRPARCAGASAASSACRACRRRSKRLRAAADLGDAVRAGADRALTRPRPRAGASSRAPGRCCGADRWRRRSGSCRPACRRALGAPTRIAATWLAGCGAAKTWPMPSRILRVSGLSANGSTLVGLGSHCWWKRGASTASWTVMP